ncbi:MAG: sugar phosphate isomerase/epimerase [bacterium]|nr:sugar phosphate isomerase/epimerase [bacterium]
MELGVSSMIFEYNDLIDYLPIMEKEGIFNVEVRGYPPRVDYHNKDYIKRLKDALVENNVKVHSYHLPFSPENGFDISLSDKAKADHAIEEFKLSLDAMLYLGAKIAVLHPGDTVASSEEREERYKHSRENIGRILEYCEKNKIKLAVENMPSGKMGERVSDIYGLISGFNSEYIGICFDTSHANMTSGNAPAEIKKCKDKLFTIHVSDNNGKKDQHYLPYSGNIDWPSFWRELNNLNYNSVFMMEVTRHLENSRFMLQEAKRRFEKIISGK